MHYYNTTAGKDLITVDEILSMYLWNQKTAPTPEELNDSKWIRQPNTLGDSLEIDLVTYMQEGPGRFVSAADIPFLVDFFNHPDIAPRETPYSHEEIWQILRPKVEEVQGLYNIDVSQYTTGIGSHDYLTRAFIFGSTKFTVDFSKIKYKVHQDGTKEISGLRIVPTQLLRSDDKFKENFDFSGGNLLVNSINIHFFETVDPSRIGRTVPIVFENENLYKETTVHQKLFQDLQHRKAQLAYSDSQKNRINALENILKLVKNSPSIAHKDNEGRIVLYNGIGEPTISLREKGENYSLVGGKKNEILVGDRGKDFLMGGYGDDILAGGYGEDILNGGEGFDTYRADNGDTIIDSDGKGEIFIDGNKLSGAERDKKKDPEGEYKSDDLTYHWMGGDLTVGGVKIKNFRNGQFGITLDEKEDKEPEAPPPDVDPLVIDMNGDGVQTLSKNLGVHFDLDNNGFAERTGWSDGEDAFLVLDRNNNGKIDSGRELFGTYTQLQYGRLAADGFEALREWDVNHDLWLDEKDDMWERLLLWQDRNRNGKTEAGELTRLSDSGIEQIGLKNDYGSGLDENFNRHRRVGEVKWKNGNQTQIEEIWFDVSMADTKLLEKVVIDEAVKSLPNVRGFGNVYSLQEAMTLNPALRQTLQRYLTATEEAQSNLLDELIYQWTGATGNSLQERVVGVLKALTGQNQLRYNSDRFSLVQQEYDKFKGYVQAQLQRQTVYKTLFAGVNLTYDGITKEPYYDWTEVTRHMATLFKEGNYKEAEKLQTVIDNLAAYSDSRQNHYIYLGSGTSSEGNELMGTEGSDSFIASEQNEIFGANGGKDNFIFKSQWGKDIIDEGWGYLGGVYNLYFSDIKPEQLMLRHVGTDLVIRRMHSDDELTVRYYGWELINKITFSDGTVWDKKEIYQQILKGTNEKDKITGLTDNDIIRSGEGDDEIVGIGEIYGEAGNDRLSIRQYSSLQEYALPSDYVAKGTLLSGGDGDDILDAGDGTPFFVQYDEQGNMLSSEEELSNILDGGAGNDILRGSYDREIYRFEQGFGQDELYERREDQTYDDAIASHDIIRFGEGIVASDIEFIRENDDLILRHINDRDSIRVHSYFIDWTPHYKINQVDFADGTSFSQEQIEAKVIYRAVENSGDLLGSDIADTIYGNNAENYIEGRSGNDRLFGMDGNDHLVAGTGNDVLDGGEHDDYLAAGADNETNTGNNILYGGRGKDTLIGGDGNDWIEGGEGDDYLAGGQDSGVNTGNDILFDNEGSNTFYGGDGNDYVIGGKGNDSYLYNENNGIDVIETGGGADTLFFRNITAERLSFHRDKDDLVVLVDGEMKQQVRVLKHFSGNHYAMEGVQAENEYIYLPEIEDKMTTFPQVEPNVSVNAMIQAMASFGTNSSASTTPSTIEELKFNTLLTASSFS